MNKAFKSKPFEEVIINNLADKSEITWTHFSTTISCNLKYFIINGSNNKNLYLIRNCIRDGIIKKSYLIQTQDYNCKYPVMCSFCPNIFAGINVDKRLEISELKSNKYNYLKHFPFKVTHFMWHPQNCLKFLAVNSKHKNIYIFELGTNRPHFLLNGILSC